MSQRVFWIALQLAGFVLFAYGFVLYAKGQASEWSNWVMVIGTSLLAVVSIQSVLARRRKAG